MFVVGAEGSMLYVASLLQCAPLRPALLLWLLSISWSWRVCVPDMKAPNERRLVRTAWAYTPALPPPRDVERSSSNAGLDHGLPVRAIILRVTAACLNGQDMGRARSVSRLWTP